MNKVVLLTGASGGLGRALYKQLMDKSYIVAICGRKENILKDMASEYNSEFTMFESFDITDYKKTEEYVNHVAYKYGKIDIVISNAGANTKRDKVSDIDIDDFKYMMDLNCFSHLNFIKCAYPYIKKNEGHIIEVLSSTCLFENPGIGSYSSSKSAMESLSKTLLKEALNDDVRVTNIYPGGINTGFRPYEKKEYMDADSVAKAIINCIELPKDAHVHELILRPKVERNY